MKNIALFLFLCLEVIVFAQELRVPSFEEVLSIQSISNAVISPDGKHVVYEVSTTDWKENKYDRELWISKDGGEPFQLTNTTDNNSRNPKWSPDGDWIAFSANRDEKNQLHAIRLSGGEAFAITNEKINVGSFEWSPDGKQIAFLLREDKEDEEKKQKDKYGSFEVDDEKYAVNQLWIIAFNPIALNHMPLPAQLEDSIYKESQKPIQLMPDADFTINDFKWSPDGSMIAFEHQPNPLINTFFKADISIYNIEEQEYKKLVNNPSYDGLIDWSPDSQSILYESSLDNSTSNYYQNDNYFRININGSNNRSLGKTFDENINNLTWTSQGIYGTAWQKTKRPMVRMDPNSGEVTVLETGLARVWGVSHSSDGSQIAYTGANDENLTEVHVNSTALSNPKKLTSSTDQISDWKYAQSEIVSWKSEDGAIIEGVLHKPLDYDPNKKYPLFVIIHGGPMGISTPNPTPSSVYPMIQWLNKGALILRPNYRGSAGYGEYFRSLNVKNLGIGDAWDVESGVKALADEGLIDPNKVGCMGWSQGGYISAFLTTNSDIFQAISVGAGISNWMTYYVNTDIHPFTRQYLKSTPWSDKAIYEKTSPMTNINNASTPTLIQHGEFDRRVPIANAYELHQGLQDVDVESKLIVYKGFGHGINKPKERLAAVWHNWQWFARHIWDEETEMP